MGLLVRLKKKVDGFSLDVAWEIGDELAVLFGYSGSGKSMTLQMITGLLRPDEGLVRSGGRTCFDSSAGIEVPPQDRTFGYVCQDLALFPHMTVMKNVLFGAPDVPKGERLSMAREMIKAFKLTGLEDHRPSEISGGQKQRVAFARALMRRPGALLLDEPFSALDTPLRSEMGRILKQIHREFEIPVVLVTHDISEARVLADRIILYENGRVARMGSFHDLFQSAAGHGGEFVVERAVYT